MNEPTEPSLNPEEPEPTGENETPTSESTPEGTPSSYETEPGLESSGMETPENAGEILTGEPPPEIPPAIRRQRFMLTNLVIIFIFLLTLIFLHRK